MKKILAFICIIISLQIFSQKVEMMPLEQALEDVSFRGLAPVSDSILWISGSNGYVGRSKDGGKTFTWVNPPNYSDRDFRDIEALDARTAIVMAIGSPGIILKTTNGGATWKEVYKDEDPDVFMDAMYFSDKKNGVLIGDALEKVPYFLTTADGGTTWNGLSERQIDAFMPSLDVGENFFASSGTNIIIVKDAIMFVSGGMKSNLYYIRNNKIFKKEIPIAQGKDSWGANSLGFRFTEDKKENFGIIVGGDFNSPGKTTGNCILFAFTDKGIEFTESLKQPRGYRSCVEILNDEQAVTCGLNGVDFSDDRGKIWRTLSKESFHVCKRVKDGNTVFLVGPKGNFARIIINVEESSGVEHFTPNYDNVTEPKADEATQAPKDKLEEKKE